MTGNHIPEWALYLRKSKGRAGIARQRTTTTAHVERLGGRVSAEFADTDRTAYRKPGGQQPRRDGFAAMLAMLRATPGLGLAAWHADRLVRNSEDTEELIRVCASGGHLVETRSGGSYDLSTANGRRRFRQDAVDASYEVDHMTERIVAMKAEAVAEGRWLGGRRPFGWQPDKEAPGGLELDEREAAAIARGYRDALARKSMYAVARDWNAAGITTTSGRPWRPTEVRRVLLRSTNAALPPAKWPALVDAGTHRAVAALLADPGRKTTPGPERTHLLSGIALCGLCGGGMVCSTIGPSRGKRAVYRCRASVEGDNGGHVARDAAALDQYVAMLVIERLSRPDARRLLLRESVSQLPRLQADRAALQGQMKASNDLRRNGLLTLAEFAEERADHQEKMTRLDERIAAAEQLDVLAPMVRDPAGTWAAADLGQRRAIVAAVMTVTVGPQAKGRPQGWEKGHPYFDPEAIDIAWNRG
jgi:DNA invertase Pin-like site-specific DNA recombinase